MDDVKELVVVLDPDDAAIKDRIETILEHFPDNRPIFDNVAAVYVGYEVRFEQVAEQIRSLVKPCDYAVFEVSNRAGEGDF